MTAPARRNILQGWAPIIGAFAIWFAHFLVIYAGALIWPHQPPAKALAGIATVVALVALAVLFGRVRAADASSDQTRFGRRFGMGSIFIAAAGILFDVTPVLFG